METSPLPQVGYAARARRAFAAGTLHTVGDDSPRAHGYERIHSRNPDRRQLDYMEHERQNRLKRWQKPPTPTRRDAA